MDLFTRYLDAGPDEVLVSVKAEPARRLFGAGALFLLCVIVLWHGYKNYSLTDEGLVQIFLGLAGMFAALRFWRGSDNGLELTPTELRETRGRQIVRITDIVAVQREAFGIIKPTNGFVIVTREKLPAAISPGIWWRLGRRIGVGGLTGGGEGRAMVELLQEMLKRRETETVPKP